MTESIRPTSPAPVVTNVRFTPAATRDLPSGLRGFVTCTVDGRWHLADLALRISAAGRPYLSFPARTTPRGLREYLVAPASDSVRREIEAAVLAALPGWVFGKDAEAAQ